MYNTTVEDLWMDWGELTSITMDQADRAYKKHGLYLDSLTGAQLQYLVDKHGTELLTKRMRPVPWD